MRTHPSVLHEEVFRVAAGLLVHAIDGPRGVDRLDPQAGHVPGDGDHIHETELRLAPRVEIVGRHLVTGGPATGHEGPPAETEGRTIPVVEVGQPEQVSQLVEVHADSGRFRGQGERRGEHAVHGNRTGKDPLHAEEPVRASAATLSALMYDQDAVDHDVIVPGVRYVVRSLVVEVRVVHRGVGKVDRIPNQPARIKKVRVVEDLQPTGVGQVLGLGLRRGKPPAHHPVQVETAVGRGMEIVGYGSVGKFAATEEELFVVLDRVGHLIRGTVREVDEDDHDVEIGDLATAPHLGRGRKVWARDVGRYEQGCGGIQRGPGNSRHGTRGHGAQDPEHRGDPHSVSGDIHRVSGDTHRSARPTGEGRHGAGRRLRPGTPERPIPEHTGSLSRWAAKRAPTPALGSLGTKPGSVNSPTESICLWRLELPGSPNGAPSGLPFRPSATRPHARDPPTSHPNRTSAG